MQPWQQQEYDKIKGEQLASTRLPPPSSRFFSSQTIFESSSNNSPSIRSRPIDRPHAATLPIRLIHRIHPAIDGKRQAGRLRGLSGAAASRRLLHVRRPWPPAGAVPLRRLRRPLPAHILHGAVSEGGVVRHLQLVPEGGSGKRRRRHFELGETLHRQSGRRSGRRQIGAGEGGRPRALRCAPEQAHQEAAAAAAYPAPAVGVGPGPPRPRRSAVARRRAGQAEGSEVQALGRGDHY